MTDTVVSSATKEVVIGFNRPFVIIGERINPTGRKILAAEMAAGDFTRVEADARAQVEAGAQMLDVNAGIPLADEPAILARAVQLVQSITDVPLSIDSSIVAALEAGQARWIRSGERISDRLREKAKTPQRERYLPRRRGPVVPQFPARGFSGRNLPRSWSRPFRRWHPRLPGQVPAAQLQVDRVQVLLEWIGRAPLRADADEDKLIVRPPSPPSNVAPRSPACT